VEHARVARSKDLQKWKTHSRALRHQHNLPASSAPWTSRFPKVRLVGLPQTPRTLDIVDTSLAVFLKKFPNLSLSQVTKGLFVNTSQGVQRTQICYSFPTPTTSSCVYSYEKDQVISGRSTMKLIGFPDSLLPREIFRDSQYRDLSGNAYSAPIMGLIVAALYSQPWATWF